MLIQGITLPKGIKQTEVVSQPQIFDLLQLSRQEKELKEFCRMALGQFGQWKKSMPYTIHRAHISSRRIHGVVLRSRAKQAVKIYKTVRRIRIETFNRYIADLPKIQG